MTRQEKLQAIEDWKANKPATDAAWAEDVKEESLHVKYDYQLAEMEESHVAKLPRVLKQLQEWETFASWKKEEIRRAWPTKPLVTVEGIEEVYQDRLRNLQWKIKKLEQSIERIKKERELRAKGFVVPDKDDEKKLRDVKSVPMDRVRTIYGTAYYVDFTNGNDTNDGLGTGTAFATLDKFCEDARSAGDTCTVRGTMTQTVSTDLTHTSDGTNAARIVLKRDFGDEWGDHVDLSITATATLTWGSKTVTYSSDISGVLAAGDRIYVSGDDNAVFSYEVRTVSTVTVTLYLPYKGEQAGSGKTTYNMGDDPIWNTAAGNFQIILSADQWWELRGIHYRGTDSAGTIQQSGTYASNLVYDCEITGNDTSATGLSGDSDATCHFIKCRITDNSDGVLQSAATRYRIYDSLFLSSINGYRVVATSCQGELYDTEFDTVITGINFVSASIGTMSTIRGRNLIFTSVTTPIGEAAGSTTQPQDRTTGVFLEDYSNTPGATKAYTQYATSSVGNPIFVSQTTGTRTGGSNIIYKVVPTSQFSNFLNTRCLLFDLPFYATTASKTYTVYFSSTATTDWTADPTAAEFYLEAEYWGHATNNYRRILKSTGTCDFNGTTDWVALSVTVAPAQAGVLYLRGWYGKPLEAGKANTFFVDPVPIIS